LSRKDLPVTWRVAAARPSSRSSRATGGPRNDRVDYAAAEHAGKPHKGRITDGEKELVRERFDEINELLADQGIRTISLTERAQLTAGRGGGLPSSITKC
jgi:hypothetical protein